MYFSGLGRLIKCAQYLTGLRHSSTGVTDLAQWRTFSRKITKVCDVESTPRRTTIVVSMERVYNLPSFKLSMNVIGLVSAELLEIVKLKGPAP